MCVVNFVCASVNTALVEWSEQTPNMFWMLHVMSRVLITADAVWISVTKEEPSLCHRMSCQQVNLILKTLWCKLTPDSSHLYPLKESITYYCPQSDLKRAFTRKWLILVLNKHEMWASLANEYIRTWQQCWN